MPVVSWANNIHAAEPYNAARSNVEVAAERGHVVVVPKPNELQIDIDNEHDHGVFHKNIPIFIRMGFPIVDHKETPSPSGKPGRYHITITLTRALTDIERIMFQAFLGSDRTRELLNFQRVLDKLENPSVFFEKPPT